MTAATGARWKDLWAAGQGLQAVRAAEAESVMTGHSAVAEVAVVGVPSDRRGESPYAAVVLRSSGDDRGTFSVRGRKARVARAEVPRTEKLPR